MHGAGRAPSDPPILLVMGSGASMLWWPEDFCRVLADGERFVIRYDRRDTGRSVGSELGRPAYTGADLVDDAAGVLDAYGIAATHVVGLSAGGGISQHLALDHPGRVRSLVLISTSSAVDGGHELPPPTEAVGRFLETATGDWTARDSVVDYLVDYLRVLTGRSFDEAAARDLARRDVERARDFASMHNHDVLAPGDREHCPLSSIRAPTLVIHGTADPMFPIQHGEALAAEIPGARLLRLEGGGHGIDPPDWEPAARAILDATAAA